MKLVTTLERFQGLISDRAQLIDAVTYALDAFQRAAEEHGCDYCRADAAHMGRALEASQRESERQRAE